MKNKPIKIPVGVEEKLVFSSDDDGKTFIVNIGKEKTKINRSDLMGLLFLFADKKEQEDLITTTEIKMKPIARLLTFTLKGDMKAGEKVKSWYQYLLPVEYANKLMQVSPEKYRDPTITIETIPVGVEQIQL